MEAHANLANLIVALQSYFSSSTRIIFFVFGFVTTLFCFLQQRPALAALWSDLTSPTPQVFRQTFLLTYFGNIILSL